MYVAVKGGERAIESAHAWLAEERRGDRVMYSFGLMACVVFRLKKTFGLILR